MRIDGNIPRPGPDGAGNLAGNTASRGLYRGEQAVLKNDGPNLTDAAEEMSLHFSEKVERQAADEHEIEAELPLQIMRAEQIRDYLDSAQSFRDPSVLVNLAKRMIDAQAGPLQLARQATDDPTEQFLLLQFALQQGEAQGAPAERLAALREAVATLEFEAGPQVYAGLNSIDAAVQFGNSPDTIRGFQNTYREVVLAAANLAQALDVILGRFGEQDFERGLTSLLKALGADLAAARPSIAPERLQTLLQDIYQLEVVNTLLDETASLARTLSERHGIARFAPTTFIKSLVGLTCERWVVAQNFLRIPNDLAIALLAAKIELMVQAQRVLRELPMKIFSDAEARRALLDAGQEALDQLIDEEDALDEEDGEEVDDEGGNDDARRPGRQGRDEARK